MLFDDAKAAQTIAKTTSGREVKLALRSLLASAALAQTSPQQLAQSVAQKRHNGPRTARGGYTAILQLRGWKLKVSRETDLTLRTYLGSQGMKKGDLSKFIEDAVRLRVLQCTLQCIRARNVDAGPDTVQRIVDEAVPEVRADRRAKRKRGKARCEW